EVGAGVDLQLLDLVALHHDDPKNVHDLVDLVGWHLECDAAVDRPQALPDLRVGYPLGELAEELVLQTADAVFVLLLGRTAEQRFTGDGRTRRRESGNRAFIRR